jgi:hypothetical protein
MAPLPLSSIRTERQRKIGSTRDPHRIRYRRHDGKAFLYAFDLIELNGDDRVAIRLRSERRRYPGQGRPRHSVQSAHRG